MELAIPHLPHLMWSFIHTQLHSDDNQLCDLCSFYLGKIYVFNSMSATFYTPSDLCGTDGMQQEFICAYPNWWNDGPRYDCVFVVTDPDTEGLRGLDVAWVLVFFSFKFQGEQFSCTIIWWFDRVGNAPNDDTGMWIIKPSSNASRQPKIAVIHIDSIFHAAHLIPVYGTLPIPSQGIPPNKSYDHFHLFYINKYADHHAFTTAFELSTLPLCPVCSLASIHSMSHLSTPS